ncbi:MAG: hypothetical protein SNJ56_00245 [Termitinemataceae bacterium]
MNKQALVKLFIQYRATGHVNLKRNKLLHCILLVCIVLFCIDLLTCDAWSEGKKSSKTTQSETKSLLAQLEGKTDPQWFSYDVELPLSQSLVLESQYYDKLAFESVFAPKQKIVSTAFWGIQRYALEDQYKVTLRNLMEPTVPVQGHEQGGVPLQVRETVLPDPSLLPFGDILAEWHSTYPVLAGPYVCKNAVVMVTSEPALECIDPYTLTPIKSIPLDHLVVSIMEFIPAERKFTALHGDGSVGSYVFLENSSVLQDPIAAYVEPSKEARTIMLASLQKYLSTQNVPLIPMVKIYPLQSKVSLTEPELFYYMPQEDGTYKAYLHDSAMVPYLIVVFTRDGQSLFSNVEYAAASGLEIPLSAGVPYYIATSLFPGNQQNALIADNTLKLVIVKK